MIKKKVSEYLERAEKLKDHLNKPTANGKPAAASANGISSGGKGKYGLPSHPNPICERQIMWAPLGWTMMSMPTRKSYGVLCQARS